MQKDDTSRSNGLRFIIVFNSVIFILLALLHFYWAFGGRLWYDAVLPTNSSGSQKLNPTKLQSICVGFGLLMFAVTMIGNAAYLMNLYRRNILK